MINDTLFTIGGTIIGSLIEEGIEEIFPGVGELGITGEISGAIAGLLGSKLTKSEIKAAVEQLIVFSYRYVNKDNSGKNIPDEDLKAFSEKFKDLPKSIKQEIINNWKSISPYEYSYVRDFLCEQ